MKRAKSLHLQSPWTVHAVYDRTGRRLLTISHNSARNPLRHGIAGRRNSVLRLAVTSVPEELTGFVPIIRIRS